MDAQTLRSQVQEKIVAFLATADASKVSAWAAYLELFPYQVDWAMFHSIWQHVRNPQAEIEHQEMLDRITPPAQKTLTGSAPVPVEQPVATAAAARTGAVS